MAIATTTPPRYQAVGSCRDAVGPRRHRLSAAVRDAERDQADCAALGGGAYSDAAVEVRVAGAIYGVGDDDEARYDRSAILAAVGDSIANGGGQRRPRRARDDWSGWVVFGGGLYRVTARWPDAADGSHEVSAEIDLICSIVR